MLNIEQRKLKWEGIAETVQYTNDKNDNKYISFVKNGNLRAARDMVFTAAKTNGYTIDAYHGTTNQEEKSTWNAERRVWETIYRPIIEEIYIQLKMSDKLKSANRY